MPVRLPDNKKKEILGAYIPGETSMAAVASEVGVSRLTVKKVLSEFGVEVIQARAKQKVFGKHGSDRRFIHGKTNTAEFTIWQGMLVRCNVTSHTVYSNYGGRGIFVCDRWLNSFENFYADMGPRPSPKHSIDRINNDGPYSPENCRWATKQEQCNNKSDNKLIEYHGEVLTAKQWADKLAIPYLTLWTRLFKYNWDVPQAFETPVKNHVRYLVFNGESHTIEQWAVILGISRRIIRYRLDELNWSVERTLGTPTKKQGIK